MSVSVCMATYNGERFIYEQLDSIIKQLTSKDEIIIVDDCSTDETIKIIKTAAKFSQIVGADINELSPIKGLDCYNFLVAKLAYKIISYTFEYKKN